MFMKLRNITYVHGEGEEEEQEMERIKSVHQSSIYSKSRVSNLTMSI